jgi:hypothetical protein
VGIFSGKTIKEEVLDEKLDLLICWISQKFNLTSMYFWFSSFLSLLSFYFFFP